MTIRQRRTYWTAAGILLATFADKFLGIVDEFYCWLASLVYGPG
jgi:hypothetical protein